MKTKILTPLSNPQAIPLLEKSRKTMRKKVILLLMFVFFYTGINAQIGMVNQQSDPVVVTEINAYFTAAKKVTATPGTKLNAQYLKTLTSNVQPSVYCYSGVVNTYGDKPVDLFTDVHSLSQVDNLVSLKNDIEIAVIKIDNPAQLNSNINLASLSGFKKLKYIYVVSTVNTTAEVIANMITNFNEKYSVFYKIDNGDKQ